MLALRNSLIAGLAFSCFIIFARVIETHGSLTVVVASFGATTVVLVCMNENKAAHFRNVFLGHLVSISIGLACRAWIAPMSIELALIVAITLSVGVMELLRSVHPPGGAAALLCVLSPQEVIGEPVNFLIGIAAIGVPMFLFSERVCRSIVVRSAKLLRTGD